jgi:hypothetical protein
MYFPDLTPYEYYVEEGDVPALNVGWLDANHEFAKGVPPAGFIERLRCLSSIRVKQMRGFQVCCFCDELQKRFVRQLSQKEDMPLYQACHKDGRFSSAELRVVGENGRIYASPVALPHYVESHGYLPPQEFIDAVMSL